MADNGDEEEYLTELDRLIAEDEQALIDLENQEEDEDETDEDRELTEAAKGLNEKITIKNPGTRRAQRRIQERLIKNKLSLIFSRSLNKTHLSAAEKKVMEQAKQFPKLKNDVKRINLLLLSNKTKNFYKMISASPVLFYILIGAMLLLLVIAVISVVGSIFSWLFAGSEGSSGNSVFGITGADFYGARMVYADDDKANKEIVENYVDFIEDGVNKAELITSIDADSKTYSVVLDVNHITIPTDYDYLNYDDDTFKSEHSTVYELAIKIAKATYKIDNSADFSGTSLIECASGIKYFGIGDFENVSKDVIQEIVTKESITATTTGDGGETVNVTDTTELANIESAIENKLIADYATSNYSLRAEKLFVKDYILDGDTAKISGLTQENYVAMIFMPNKNVTFKNFSFAVGNVDLNKFKISVNGESLSTDGNNLGGEENSSYIFGTGNVNISASTFTYINTENLSELSNGLSLFEIINNSDLNCSLYLDTTTEVITINKNGVVVEITNENNNPFNFVEWETGWIS